MKSKEDIKKVAQETLNVELEAVKSLYNSINDDFLSTVDTIYNSKGRVIITGIGKSANIANKIVSTLNSTGTPAIFMHAADAIHGDLGIVCKDDVVICISKSGNTPEIKVLIPLLKRGHNPLIAITGNTNSFLATSADLVLNTSVSREACPNNLAPTASTTAQLVMGDMLAVCLLEKRGFSSQDFAKYHPGGSLGKRLYLTVKEMAMENERPEVTANTSIPELIIEISSKRLGVAVVTENNKIIGVITDGDLRRMLENNRDFSNLKASDIMTRNPRSISCDILAVEALEIMKKNNITQLIVIDSDQYLGVVHMHDILKEGII